MDLTTKFADFFRSEHKTLKDFDKSLNESASANAWIEAVTLWRTGIKKMKENDLTGLDDLKKANETLKTVVAKNPNEGLDKQFNQLNESVSVFNKTNMEEEIEMLEYQVGSLVDKLQENGVDIEDDGVDADDAFELNGCVMDDETPAKPALEDPAKSVAPFQEVAKVAPAPVAAPVVAPAPVAAMAPAPAPQVPAGTAAAVAIDPNLNATPAPVVEAVKPKKSGYAEGFTAGQTRYKKGEKFKDMVKKIVEGELYEQPYAFVQRYQEGFASGFAYAEQVDRDLSPQLYEESDTSDN
jgi:hypothetical protein